MAINESSAEETADLLLQLGRTAYADCAGSGLTQAQWIAIRYFSRANRFSRTISGFAQFHATTRGTASQTVKMLVDKGYLVRTRSARDARSVRFDLTPEARRKLREDPLQAVVRVAGRLSGQDRERMTRHLRDMLAELEQGCGQDATGMCRLCGHLDTGSGRDGAQCRLMQEPLKKNEFEELCVRFEARD